MVNDLLPKKAYDPYMALRVPAFRSLLISRSTFTIAMQMVAVVVGWQIYDLTKDPLLLGLTGLFEAIGYVGVAFISGSIVDRGDAKNILQKTFLAKIILITGMIFLTATNHADSDRFLYATYFLLFSIGLCRGFYSPSTFTLLSSVVPKESMLNASTWNSSFWQLAFITGPTLGGLCYAFKGALFAYSVALIVLIGGFISLFFIKILNHEKDLKAQALESFSDRIFGGMKFVFHHKLLLWAMSLDMFAVLFGGAVALLPMFASDILKVGPTGLGILRASPAIGSALMGFLLAYLPPMKNAGKNMLIAIGGFGLCMLSFALSKNIYLSFLFLALSGACDNISVIVRQTILQMHTPENMRGRVAAVGTIFISSSNEIGAFESGLSAKFLGAVGSVLFGGTMTICIVLFSWFKSSELRKLKFD